MNIDMGLKKRFYKFLDNLKTDLCNYFGSNSNHVYKKDKIAKVSVKPGDTRETDYNLSLADYFHRELKTAGIANSKKDALVEVKLNGLYNDKYDRVIIDCIGGKLYLRGNNVKDKYWGRLRRFMNGGTKADSYHCIAQSGTRTINRIKRLMDSFKNNECKDKCKDERKHKLIKACTRKDHRRIQAIICNKQLVAKRKDDRTKYKIVMIDMRSINNTLNNKTADVRSVYQWLTVKFKIVTAGMTEESDDVTEFITFSKVDNVNMFMNIFLKEIQTAPVSGVKTITLGKVPETDELKVNVEINGRYRRDIPRIIKEVADVIAGVKRIDMGDYIVYISTITDANNNRLAKCNRIVKYM